MTFCVTFASSVFSTGTTAGAAEFGVSTEVSTLGTSLFVLGFAFGPLVSQIALSRQTELMIH
jgi:DHA1 family multidrug resistance protein-like MFS transporter